MNSGEFRLDGKTALVVGVGPAIGSHVAKAFADAGANVVVNARRETAVRELVTDIRRQHGDVADGIAADVGDARELARILGFAERRFRQIDIVFYNAFAAGAGPQPDSTFKNESIFDCSDEDWEACFRVNVMAPFRFAKMVVPSMMRNGGGTFIHTLAAAGFSPLYTQAVAYGATKAALAMMTRYLAKACGPLVRFNAISPSNIQTPGHTEAMRVMAKTFPLGRMGTATEVAGAALFLASPASSFITGQVIFVDGGRIMTA
jgi:NAD(P)-dependent dehydrogenase (short-subunit alcohol dehydrogenase family)